MFDDLLLFLFQRLETSGFLQIFLITWMTHIIRKGLQKTLEQEDLGNCPDTLKSKQTLKKLKIIMYEQENKHGKHNISLFWIYMLLIRRKLLTVLTFVGVNIIVEFLLAVSYLYVVIVTNQKLLRLSFWLTLTHFSTVLHLI